MPLPRPKSLEDLQNPYSKSNIVCPSQIFGVIKIKQINYRKIYVHSLFFCLCGFIGCASPHIRHHIERVSRDYIYVDFLENNNPFEIISKVGGEHMTFYKVLAFKNDKFCVTLTTFDGVIFGGISGEGIRIESLSVSRVQKKMVIIEAQEAIFSVDISAHPYGEYQLKIEKLNHVLK